MISSYYHHSSLKLQFYPPVIYSNNFRWGPEMSNKYPHTFLFLVSNILPTTHTYIPFVTWIASYPYKHNPNLNSHEINFSKPCLPCWVSHLQEFQDILCLSLSVLTTLQLNYPPVSAFPLDCKHPQGREHCIYPLCSMQCLASRCLKKMCDEGTR